jgi:CDP-diacylglycerol--glycerol-3-phosphate 3-phosphatidyltransferase
MANLITVARLLLLFVVVGFLYRDPVGLAAVSMISLAVVFAGDGLDGWVARRRGSTSQFGAVFDIAGDRVVETVLWVVFADLGVIGVWVPLLVITRGSIVDVLRSLSYGDGMTAFGERNMMRSPLTRWLTAGRFMRGLYGYAKAIAFLFLAGLVAYREPSSEGRWVRAVYDADVVRYAGWFFVWLAVALTVIRGLPVIVDSLAYLREREPRAPAPTAALPRPADPTRAAGGHG